MANVTIKNVKKMPFLKMLKALEPIVLEDVPEGILGEAEAYRRIEELIGRFANHYSHLIYLYAYVANEVNKAKRKGNKRLRDDLIRKKDALYELARSLRYKHEACSRMLTAALGWEEGDVFDKPDVRSRAKKVVKVKKRMPGWEAVS